MSREISALSTIIDSLGPPRKIKSRAPKYRRASVAIIIRIRPDHNRYAQYSTFRQPQQSNEEPSRQQLRPIQAIENPESVDEFFSQDWVRTGIPEVLFIERATRKTDRWSGHVALPGGKREEGDEDDQETAARETMEEIGLDLSDLAQFRCLGALDDRELWTSFGRVFLMVLSPFVYIQLSPSTPPLKPQPDEVASVHWQPLSLFLDRLERPLWTPMTINLSSKLTPRLSRTFLRGLFGTMSLHSIEMPYKPEFVVRASYYGQERNNQSGTIESSASTPSSTSSSMVIDYEPEWDPDHRPLKLWGLTLQMMADLLELKDGPIQRDIPQKVWDSKRMRRRLDAGFLPRFSQIDMHIWVRALLKFHSWQGTEKKKATQSNRVGSWESYYRLVKQAFLFVILGRVVALAVLVKLLKAPLLRAIQGPSAPARR
ncbi:hypothetical protein BX616_000226 [Lobosporangium transversale]|uniref:Nudix hydrolase domain-containing protein n=1 Tax=Lobosporangium transversale TaxID=64571 RepID=A0A1Y2GL06_9FUNG|nr:hypothetical protein BCR41DRAFT_422812 [Lobosporangium transversale]KAF9908183.1 hypothetical protein BX616_000226 [Lobosporangium transversale]ORZ13934.1 hypothetical protein BCR41DRAFT_422812 [Lobosporangium transversale]|eukprot:XP_021880718.1 hypothetical protein BCR41DRAFT_422812 [Lobosporangium transversale]